MKLQHPILRRMSGFAVATLTRAWMNSLDMQAAFYDETVDLARANFRGPAIYVFWHENILTPFYLRGRCNLAMLLSRHRDADWLAEAAAFMGFESVRGSSFRGGGTALRELTRKVQENNTNIGITPDGPRGPRRVLAQGPIFLASKLGIPIVASGIGYDCPWRLPTWDRFAAPRPFSRARIIMSPHLHIPADLDRAGVEHYRQHVETLLNRLTLEAEAWATSGSGKRQQVVGVPTPKAMQRRTLASAQTNQVLATPPVASEAMVVSRKAA